MSASLRLVYFDASSLVKRYVPEPGQEQVLELLAGNLVATSRLTSIEITSALARRCREGTVTSAERDRALDALTKDSASILQVEITPAVVRKSSSLLQHYPLRAADALHLASCLVFGAELPLVTCFSAFDQRLLEAARAEGLEIV